MSSTDHDSINRINQLKHEFNIKLAELERIHNQQIESERNIILNSWRWCLGNFQVNLVLRIIDFLMKPIQIFRNSIYSGKKLTAHTKHNKQRSEKFSDSSGTNASNQGKPNIACIFDTFTASCFDPEFNILSPRPDNWKRMIKLSRIDALFCESAWNGNNASWRFQIGKIGSIKKKGLSEFVKACQLKGIPTIFWNKEDPVHFEHFIDDAKQFDYIFTTDESIIPQYRKYTGHDHIYPLPFAAQEKIHNPILTGQRDKNVCFAGSYYNTQHVERIYDMEMLLKPALEFGLEIFDRNFGASGNDKIKYGFPEIYQPNIKGRLNYDEMISAYKKFKVFLNVNSVKYSPTMCSRRVFELLACGTPVISTYSKAIVELLGEDTVLISESERETREFLEKLIHDESFWWKVSLNGIRKVLERHTYNHRADFIFRITGIETANRDDILFLIIAEVKLASDVKALFRMLAEQICDNYKILLKIDPQPDDELAEMLKYTDFHSLKITGIVSSELEYEDAIRNIAFTHAAIINTNNYYGKNYLSDFAHAIRYSKASILGKKSIFNFQPDGKVTTVNKGFEFRYVDEVQYDTLIIEKGFMQKLMLQDTKAKEIFNTAEKTIFSTDAYNFLKGGCKAYIESTHFISKLISI